MKKSLPPLLGIHGQCLSCMYQMPTPIRNDGTVSVAFTSPTIATMQLAVGCVAGIQSTAW